MLVPCSGRRPPERIDAIVVPTKRPASFLTAAIALARELDCPLIVLCSGDSQAQAAVSLFGATDGGAVTFYSTLKHPLLSLRTQRPVTALAQPYLDTANKRNLGLLLGRMLGWRRVLFLDDDIRALTAAEVAAAAAALSPDLPVVGWRYPEFPDNSVVCHARRSSGQEQDVFMAAGALLVELTGALPFFPPVYNEDWLFIHDFVLRRAVGLAGNVTQVGYDPFHDPHRARQEEFGDVLAEGLYALIHDRRSVLVGCLPSYWVGVLAERRDLLAGICRRLWWRRIRHRRTGNGYEIAAVLRSLAAARAALGRVTAIELAEYTSQWRYDVFCWNARLHRLPRFARLVDALAWLEVTDVHLAVLETDGAVGPEG